MCQRGFGSDIPKTLLSSATFYKIDHEHMQETVTTNKAPAQAYHIRSWPRVRHYINSGSESRQTKSARYKPHSKDVWYKPHGSRMSPASSLIICLIMHNLLILCVHWLSRKLDRLVDRDSNNSLSICLLRRKGCSLTNEKNTENVSCIFWTGET